LASNTVQGGFGVSDELILYYAPQSRAGGVRILLEELGVPYTLHTINIKAGEQLQPAYLAVNPMGKVPAIRHNGAIVTEQVAIYIYLADAYASAGLAPPIGDKLRGPYLRWLVFYGTCVEPAAVDRAMKREPGGRAMSPYGDFDTVIGTIVAQLRTGPWLLGERYTAADTLWGTALGWMTKFGIIPGGPEIDAYLARFQARPAVQAAQAKEAAEAGSA
jgi:glutathione S-transferase